MDTIQEFQYFAEQLNESEVYDSEKLYLREAIVKRIRKGPGYMQQYLAKLPEIECTDPDGNRTTCTQIPEVIFNYLYNRNF